MYYYRVFLAASIKRIKDPLFWSILMFLFTAVLMAFVVFQAIRNYGRNGFKPSDIQNICYVTIVLMIMATWITLRPWEKRKKSTSKPEHRAHPSMPLKITFANTKVSSFIRILNSTIFIVLISCLSVYFNRHPLFHWGGTSEEHDGSMSGVNTVNSPVPTNNTAHINNETSSSQQTVISQPQWHSLGVYDLNQSGNYHSQRFNIIGSKWAISYSLTLFSLNDGSFSINVINNDETLFAKSVNITSVLSIDKENSARKYSDIIYYSNTGTFFLYFQIYDSNCQVQIFDYY